MRIMNGRKALVLCRKLTFRLGILIAILVGFRNWWFSGSSCLMKVPEGQQVDVGGELEQQHRQIFQNPTKLSMEDNRWYVRSWHQKLYDKYQQEQNYSTGPGDQGQAVILEQGQSNDSSSSDTCTVISNMVSLDRTLKDYRPPQCKTLVYPKNLPKASILIVMGNEPLSEALRTLHSIINRSPPEYIQEIIVVLGINDDVGRLDALEHHIQSTYKDDGLIRIISATERLGVVGSSLFGIRNATGEIVIKFDGHMEVSKGWIEPLLARLKEKPDVILCPGPDVLTDRLEYIPGTYYGIQSYAWQMTNRWEDAADHPHADPTKPMRSLAVWGPCWAVNREIFWELGGLDEGMIGWGGEDLEIALRYAMCGGGVEFIHCSRVAHMYRGDNQCRIHVTVKEPQQDWWYNFHRTAEIWLDEYRHYFYLYHPSRVGKNFGDISKMLEFKRTKKCKGFKWFLQNIDFTTFMPDVNVSHWGVLQNEETGMCLKLHSRVITVSPCNIENNIVMETAQIFSLMLNQHLRSGWECIVYWNTAPGDILQVGNCRYDQSNYWIYQEKNMIHKSTGWCLTVKEHEKSDHQVILEECEHSKSQSWIWVSISFPF